MSRISIIHYLKLIYRSCLFIAATVIYTVNRAANAEKIFFDEEHRPFILFLIWLVFVVEMLFRFFPSKFESMGCQKQFKRNFKPVDPDKNRASRSTWKSTLLVAVLWIALNGIIGALYYTDIIDEGILVLISLAFSVCDMICILFFCPFQTWIMKNKCCTSCRIYNWDYAMMFTPMIFIKDAFALSILFFAVVLLLRWELTAHIHPERFSEETNACLSCGRCEEKLCHHKKQLKQFLKKNHRKIYSFMEEKLGEHTNNINRKKNDKRS